MSIYASLNAPSDGQHEDECTIYIEEPPGSGSYEFSGNPCSCGQPDAPLIYQGSHVLPSDSDERGGYIDFACVPGHVRYPDADDGRGLPPEPFLRCGVNGETVVLTRRHVKAICAELLEWIAKTEQT